MASQKTQDFFMAYDLNEELNCLGVTENANLKEKENYRPRTLIDRTLEFIDPTPNIHTLFMQFNTRFFWNVLLSVEVKWSNRMTSCAGICSFRRFNKQCVISLSAPLLKLRPRKDLVETLLHEMIHGYLFLTNNDRDRDGHGPNFCKHMHRINEEAGTNITIYHNFHDEVKLYQQHWWKCNGPCQYRPPYFGTVRRAMNRAPAPSDIWWDEHKKNCNGQFIKIREPENFRSNSKQKDKSKLILKDKKLNKDITDWFTKNTPVKSASTHSKVFTHTNSKILIQTNKNNNKSTNSKNCTNPSRIEIQNNSSQNSPLGIKKLGNTSNNVHGWSISGPSGKIEKDNTRNIVSKSPKFTCSGTLGGSNSGQSILLKKFLQINDKNCSNEKNSKEKFAKKDSALRSPPIIEKKVANKSFLDSDLDLNQPTNDFVSCPICERSINLENINKHVDICLITNNKTKEVIETSDNNTKYKRKTSTTINNEFNNNEDSILPIQVFSTPVAKQTTNTIPNKRLKLDDVKCLSCPVCNKMFPSININQHLDKCLSESDKTSTSFNSHVSSNDSIISISSSSSSNLDDSVFIEDPKTQFCTDVITNKNNIANCKQKCLVCNVQIAPEISLNEHLEECIGPVFNDDIMIEEDEDNIFVENNSNEGKYPCPLCMQIIPANLMNHHLDICLENK